MLLCSLSVLLYLCKCNVFCKGNSMGEPMLFFCFLNNLRIGLKRLNNKVIIYKIIFKYNYAI